MSNLFDKPPIAAFFWRYGRESVAHIGSWFRLSIFYATNENLKFDATCRKSLKKSRAIPTLNWFVIDSVPAKLSDQGAYIVSLESNAFPVMSEVVSYLAQDFHVFELLLSNQTECIYGLDTSAE